VEHNPILRFADESLPPVPRESYAEHRRAIGKPLPEHRPPPPELPPVAQPVVEHSRTSSIPGFGRTRPPTRGETAALADVEEDLP
jgi:hypothetical protein